MPTDTDRGAAGPRGPAPHEDSWVALAEDVVPALFARLARRTGGDVAWTEDLTQEAWLRMLRAFAGKPPPDEPLAWLTRTATNLLRNEVRRPPLRPLDEPVVVTETQLEPPSDEAAAALLQLGLARLPPAQAELVTAHHLDGTPLDALARSTGLSIRAIEGRLHRARKALRKHLERLT